MAEIGITPKILMTNAEAAASTGFSVRSISYAIKEGSLPSVRHGRRVFVSPDALRQFALLPRQRMTPSRDQEERPAAQQQEGLR